MDDNLFYSFARCALISYYNYCNEHSSQSYYNCYIDEFTLESYLDKLENIFKFYMKG